jgi:hypothetical protein
MPSHIFGQALFELTGQTNSPLTYLRGHFVLRAHSELDHVATVLALVAEAELLELLVTLADGVTSGLSDATTVRAPLSVSKVTDDQFEIHLYLT